MAPPAHSLEPGAWFATPVTLIAGLDHVQMSRAGIVRLSANEASALASDFARTFGTADFSLRAIDGYEGFALRGLKGQATTVDPARLAGSDIGSALPTGASARELRRLGSEFELWLHDHPLNATRRRANAATISTLWLWGGQGEVSEIVRPLEPSSGEARGSAPRLLWCRESDAYASEIAVRANVLEVVAEHSAARGDAQARWTTLFAESTTDAAQAVEWVALQRGVRDSTEVLAAIESGCASLRAREIDALTVFANDTVFRARRWDLWKPWWRATGDAGDLA